MAIVRIKAESGGRPLRGATVTVYTEDDTVAAGSEDSGFTSGDEETIYSDRDLSTAITGSTLTTDSDGEATFYVSSGTNMAVKINRTGWGTEWRRDVEALGSDPI